MPGSGFDSSEVDCLGGVSGALHRRGTPVEGARMRELYHTYRQALLSYARRYALNHHDAEDLVQEALVRAWRHPQVVNNPEANVLAWLRRVVRNLAIDRMRAQGCRPVTITDEMLTYMPSRRDAMDELLTAQVVREALRELTPTHRAVLAELYLAGRSVREASARLGVPSGTVKSRSYHALRALRAVLERGGLASDVEAQGAASVTRLAVPAWGRAA